MGPLFVVIGVHFIQFDLLAAVATFLTTHNPDGKAFLVGERTFRVANLQRRILKEEVARQR